ncbi:MAG: formate dehydrogenase accessory sulfurtransferase FdhD [Cytophagales bacterium]
MKVESKHTFKYHSGGVDEKPDLLAIEEPLEIRISFLQGTKRVEKSLSVTMRTPGNDEELTLGFLLTENIINNPREVISIKHCLQVAPKEEGNVIRAILKDEVNIEWEKLQRHFYSSSSCGVCGKSALENIACQIPKRSLNKVTIEKSFIDALSDKVKNAQEVFNYTGGLHAAAIFSKNGELLALREDIGRHNAVDKIIGIAAAQNFNSVQKHLLWVSGRAGFELVQKALMADFRLMVAVGAPSSLAVDLAKENKLILIGFSRNDRFNVYSGTEYLEIL